MIGLPVSINGCYIVNVMEAKRGLHGALAVFVVGLVLAGCGGGGSSGPGTDVSSGTEPSAQFLKATGNKELVEFGVEASPPEREAANAVLKRNLEARAAADFATQCATLSAKAIEGVTLTAHASPAGKSPKGCAGKLRELATPLANSKEARENRLNGPLPAFRIKGKRGFALFHGTDEKNWVMPREKEGEWRVGALQEEELPPKAASKSPAGSKKTSG
jgi:hypothetical protein